MNLPAVLGAFGPKMAAISPSIILQTVKIVRNNRLQLLNIVFTKLYEILR